MENANGERIVKQEDAAEGVRVSTVFLALDHGFGYGEPVLWETMVFGGSLDQECDRYTSREEAEAGHAAMVERVKAALSETK